MAEPSAKAAALSTTCSAQVRLDHEGEAATVSNATHSTPATCVKESARIVSTMGYTTAAWDSRETRSRSVRRASISATHSSRK